MVKYSLLFLVLLVTTTYAQIGGGGSVIGGGGDEDIVGGGGGVIGGGGGVIGGGGDEDIIGGGEDIIGGGEGEGGDVGLLFTRWGGVLQLYATDAVDTDAVDTDVVDADAVGNAIDIDVTNGSDLLINGDSVATQFYVDAADANLQQQINNLQSYVDSAVAQARADGVTAGQQDVISSPSDYNLIGAEGVFDMRVSQPGISTNGDKASMNFTIQSSNDLEEWNNEETIRREYSMPSGKNFMRVSAGPEIEPELGPLPSIATDTYGDRPVYDESNNLYVNDENIPLTIDGVNIRTDTNPGWSFYAIESTRSGYIGIWKSSTQIYEHTYDSDGNFISGSYVVNLSLYESLLGQSLN